MAMSFRSRSPEPAAPSGGGSLVDALERLREQLRRLRLPLEAPGAAEARRGRDELAGQLEDYVLPRLRHLDAPLLAVVGGSTGAGKSTLVNSLVGADVSPASVLRPTTRAPVLVHHPADEEWFVTDRILPGLAREMPFGEQGPVSPPPDDPRLAAGSHGDDGASEDGGSLRLVADGAVPEGLALLDAPDIDSVVAANRVLASQLLAAGDLWLFVTTAARYADAVPWGLLRAARSRSTALALVLNRVPVEAAEEVPRHLAAMLGEAGLGGAPIFTVAEAALSDGRLPEAEVTPLRAWLTDLVADAAARQGVVRRTLEGALDSVAGRGGAAVAAVEAQRDAAAALADAAERAYGAAVAEVHDGLASGALLRGEVLARWQEFVGTGEFMRSLEARIGQARDRLRQLVTGRTAPATEVRADLAAGIQALVTAAAERAAERTVEAWRATPAGAAVVGDDARDLGRASPELAARAAEAVRAWQGRVLELVASQGAEKRTTARFLSYGVNAAGAALMVAVFAHTGGLTGGEVAVAGGTSALSQKLLEALFGDQAVRELAASARDDLVARLDALLDAEAARFADRLEALAPAPGEADELRAALSAVAAARRAEARGRTARS